MVVELGLVGGGYDLGVVVLEVVELVDAVGRGLPLVGAGGEAGGAQNVHVQLVHVVARPGLVVPQRWVIAIETRIQLPNTLPIIWRDFFSIRPFFAYV